MDSGNTLELDRSGSASPRIARQLCQRVATPHPYAVTSHRSRGMTADTVLVGFDRHSIRFANQKLSYVAATRGRTSIRVLVENKADLCGIQDRTGEREAATAVFFPQSIVKKPTPKPFLKNWFGPVKREDPTIVMEG